MEIVINHLTKMSLPRICVAGLSEDMRVIRPLPTRGGATAS